jgi:predicted outer membrane repeat protein
MCIASAIQGYAYGSETCSVRFAQYQMQSAGYVSSLHGDDANPGTQGLPVKTIQKVIDIVSDGGIVYLEADSIFTGAGNNNITINKNLTLSTYNSGTSPIIDMQSTMSCRFCTIDGSYTVTIYNLDIRNGAVPDGGAGIYVKAPDNGQYCNLYIYGCNFSGNKDYKVEGGAIYAMNLTEVYIEQSSFTDNMAYGVGGAVSSCGRLTVAGSIFKNNSTKKGSGGAVGVSTLLGNDVKGVLHDSYFENNYAVGSGGAFATYDGQIEISRCIFKNNKCKQLGGAVVSMANRTNMLIQGSSFSNNESLSNYGGAINADDAKSLEIVGCRFVDNKAYRKAFALSCANVKSLKIKNNWWGSNSPDLEASTLLYGASIQDIKPWITVTSSLDPAIVIPGRDTSFAITFTPNCIPDGTPVVFSITDGTVTPTLSVTTNGKAVAILNGLYAAGRVEAIVDKQMLSALLRKGHARYNFGCVCNDADNKHVLVGIYNDPDSNHNLLLGCLFDANNTTTLRFDSIDFGSELIYNMAVYNVDDTVYIALLTKQGTNHYVRVARAADDGTGYKFTLGSSAVVLEEPATKVQWINNSKGFPHIAIDMQKAIQIFKVDLVALSCKQHDLIPNKADECNSRFLYWATGDSGLFLIQGYDDTHIIIYGIDSMTCKAVNTGTKLDLGTYFSAITACSTCYNYLVIGGIDRAHNAVIVEYKINTNGTLSYSNSCNIGSSKMLYYLERCCCNTSAHLLVGTDKGLYTINPTTYDIIASHEGTNSHWLNVCWCCSNSLQYCAATDSEHSTYILDLF